MGCGDLRGPWGGGLACHMQPYSQEQSPQPNPGQGHSSSWLDPPSSPKSSQGKLRGQPRSSLGPPRRQEQQKLSLYLHHRANTDGFSKLSPGEGWAGLLPVGSPALLASATSVRPLGGEGGQGSCHSVSSVCSPPTWAVYCTDQHLEAIR